MTTQTELQSLPDHLRDTGNPIDADLLERAAEDYSALLARNNVLSAKVEELEAKLVRKISLPKITDEILDGWRGPVYLIDKPNSSKPDWTQDAVDFSALIGRATLEQDDE